MAFSLGLFSGCDSNYVNQEGDFSLEILVDKTAVHVGDTIKVTVKLQNLSGKNVRIQMRHPDFKKLEDMILIELFDENEEHKFDVTSKGGPRKILTVKKDAVIAQTKDFQIESYGNYEVSSLVVFYVGKGYIELVSITGETKKIVASEIQ